MFTITGCVDNQKSDFEKDVDYLKTQDVFIYTYQEVYEKLQSNLDNCEMISNFTDISIASGKYTAIVINCRRYSQFDPDKINYLYSLLESNKNVAVLFVDAPDYEFFRNTHFDNEKKYYANQGEYIRAYYNFDPLSLSIKEEDYYFSTDSESTKTPDAVITFLARKVRSYAASE